MQLNQATDYAFRMVLHLATLPHGTIINGQTLAEKENIPQRFLLKIMRSLSAAGIVRSYRGVDGGFALEMPAKDITLLTVIEAMEGPVAIHRCLAERSACTKFCSHDCPVHEALGDIQDQMVAALVKVDFETLAVKKLSRGGDSGGVACKCSL